MSTQTVLVIDDSSTIRKMVDSHLTQKGYRVVLAPTAEKGLELAPQLVPDIILLDHQLPGTTGIEVCRKIIAMPECMQIPFVISSTLRKQAYVEYMDVPNVVDSLPKPFRPDLLIMTIENALEVGAMIISSQTSGTAVPEVVGEVADASLSGSFDWVSLRELLDFLNNGTKSGALEIELEHDRVWFYLDGGRIQSVTSASVLPETVAETLPESLAELAPLLKFTMSSGFNSQVDGLVELLDRKVLDPRMLRTLLRFQAAFLASYCFEQSVKSFSFFADRTPPALFRRTPLEISLTGLLVQASLECGSEKIEHQESNIGWIRRGLRGQNLDRSGLGAKQVQLLTHLGQEPLTTADLAAKSTLSLEETYRSLEGFRLADWVETQMIAVGQSVVALEPDPKGSSVIRELLLKPENGWTGKVVRDEFGLQLLLNRQSPDFLLIAVSGDEVLRAPACLEGKLESLQKVSQICLIIGPQDDSTKIDASLSSFPVLQRPYSASQLQEKMMQISQHHGEKNSQSETTPQVDAGEVLLAAGVK